ncbi:substrate-binding domain-containing protein [Ochrobactrum sp. CM-21-5]|nr:substrate-binding domain-containing protein [Ochrobactrum sp. CM-21-5]MBC2886351.1 substrate-binding domain-containing protein [Ochrobactrum sp. CM-21-5]
MRHSKKKATIYDLSVLSGSSPSTVSAVLNGTWRKRRISQVTAEAILKLAELHEYTANRQAQGLRQSRSGLVGLLLPLHDNRFFSSMAQTFEAHVRRRGLCPVVVSASRDPEEERETAETLISYAIDELFICGATDPDSLHELCEKAALPHVNIDLPGSRGPSVTTDNFAGGVMLTKAIIDYFGDGQLQAEDLCLFGGRNDESSRERIRAFHHVKQTELGSDPEGCVFRTGYSPLNTKRALNEYRERHGLLPRGLFVNSSINLEGLLRYMAEHADESLKDLVVGCYDYDPFASFLPFPVISILQDVEAMIAKAFELMERRVTEPELHLVMPKLIAPRSAIPGPLDALKDIK